MHYYTDHVDINMILNLQDLLNVAAFVKLIIWKVMSIWQNLCICICIMSYKQQYRVKCLKIFSNPLCRYSTYLNIHIRTPFHFYIYGTVCNTFVLYKVSITFILYPYSSRALMSIWVVYYGYICFDALLMMHMC